MFLSIPVFLLQPLDILAHFGIDFGHFVERVFEGFGGLRGFEEFLDGLGVDLLDVGAGIDGEEELGLEGVQFLLVSLVLAVEEDGAEGGQQKQ